MVKVELSELDWHKIGVILAAGVRQVQEAEGSAIEYAPTLRRLEQQIAKAVRLSDAETPTNPTP